MHSFFFVFYMLVNLVINELDNSSVKLVQNKKYNIFKVKNLTKITDF